jgi:hypothetical protein
MGAMVDPVRDMMRPTNRIRNGRRFQRSPTPAFKDMNWDYTCKVGEVLQAASDRSTSFAVVGFPAQLHDMCRWKVAE